MIHSNPVPLMRDVVPHSTLMLMDNVYLLLNMCVPFFFIISGYLFFNFSGFDFHVICRKWKSRFFSLVLPYVLWCSLYGVIRYIKAAYFGYPGDGIVVGGEFSVTGFIKGYWDTGDGYPMGFVLWFIRNLIIFDLAAPLVFFIGRYWLATVAALCLPWLAIGCMELEYIEYFILGAALGIHRVGLTDLIKRHLYLLAVIWLSALILCNLFTTDLYVPLCCMGFCLAMPLAAATVQAFPRVTGFIDSHANAFLFIYAVHGLYCLQVDKIMVRLIGPAAPLSASWCMLASFIVNALVAVLILIMLKNVSPTLLNILSGGRYKSNKN